MKCIFCGCEDSKVIDSRANDDDNSIRRRRECVGCGRRFTTYETIEVVPILVIKSDGTIQAFDAGKIKKGIIKACEKRPVTIAQIDGLVDKIEKHYQNNLTQEVRSKDIGEMVMNGLKELDEIAYIRYASIYRKFKDVTNLMAFLKDDFKDIKE